MIIREINKDEILAVVGVHNDSFKKFFLTELGDDFLKVYYNAIRKSNKAVLIACFNQNELSGFCVATELSKGFNKDLIFNNLIDFTLVGLKLFFTKPRALIRLFKNLSKSDDNANDTGNYAELLSIGVSNNMQGQGIGTKLLNELEILLKNRECFVLSLTTDFYNNENTIKFYKSLGYEVNYEFTTYPNRKMYRLNKKII